MTFPVVGGCQVVRVEEKENACCSVTGILEGGLLRAGREELVAGVEVEFYEEGFREGEGGGFGVYLGGVGGGEDVDFEDCGDVGVEGREEVGVCF